MKRRIFDGRKLEWFLLILFAVAYLTISVCHEPWFDEAQAWEIAKGASLKEILLLIPHYEGHPPLWHLILLVPAKIGVPFELGIKTIGTVISISTAVLLLFRSKLPRVARLCLPFTYFFFYQYGVIVRSYGLMILILLLLGMNFSRRKDHPWIIISLLSLLCLCSAFGIVIAGGIAISIVVEIIQDKGIKQAVVSFFMDSRTLSLLVLLILAIILLFELLPKAETYYAAYAETNPFILCFTCALLTFPAECFLTSATWFSIDRTLLQTSSIDIAELITLCFIGVIVWILIICSSSKKKLQFLLVPYVLLAAFSARVYFSGHHLGVIFMFFLFWAEFIFREDDRFEIGKNLMRKIVTNEKDNKLIRNSYAAIGVACLVVPIVWSIISSVNDIKYNYYYSRETAAFLKEHGLTDCNIFGNWHEGGSLIPFSEEDEGYVNTVMIGTAVPINAYFQNNIFFNLNHGLSDKGFIYHRRPTHEESVRTLEEWRSVGYPDVIIGKPNLELVYGYGISHVDYSLVALVRSKFIWKTSMTSEGMPVFLRNDLLDEYQLVGLDSIKFPVNGIEITDEMRERFENGEPIEDILKPYLDAMFGEEK